VKRAVLGSSRGVALIVDLGIVWTFGGLEESGGW
jgi:hypothetical protein